MDMIGSRGAPVLRSVANAAGWMLRCLDSRRADARVAERLAGHVEHRRLEPGRVVFAEGRMPSGVWIVRSGALELSSGSGRHRVVVAVLGPCGIAGDVPLLLGRPAVCTARALGDVQALYLPAAVFAMLLETEPGFSRAWLNGVAARQAHAQDAFAGTVGASAQSRLARLLLREARDGIVSCSQSTLAAMAGLRRPTVNQILKEFERDGLVSIGYRQVSVLSIGQLTRRAGAAGR